MAGYALTWLKMWVFTIFGYRFNSL